MRAVLAADSKCCWLCIA